MAAGNGILRHGPILAAGIHAAEKPDNAGRYSEAIA